MVDDFTKIPTNDRIIVALDCDHDEAIAIAKELSGLATWVKVGMTLYYACGPRIVEELKALGFKVFLDLKLYDIPHQVRGATCSAVSSGADMLTVHASGGIEMMQAAMEGASDAVSRYRIEKPSVIGVTVLTSFDDAGLRQIGIERASYEQVELLGACVAQADLDGVVCSPHEARALRNVLGPSGLVVTPGVRLASSVSDDQKRVATPSFAFGEGASHIVVGRPITQAQDKRSAFERIVHEG
ncbi:MAG: orotidine-5'-phosphate decarboxylase [Eggerthellaceae bacterium]|nr:orotidine-5'-phosphate decarboxylase [Eggerthellaceae bacterium]